MFGESTERWSLPLGSWRGIPLRLHLSLLVVAVVVTATTATSNPVGGAILFGVVLLSAMLHEAAHRVAAYRLHGATQPLTLTPIGGLRLPSVASDPEAQLLVAMVGPLVNLTLVVISAGALAYTTNNLAEVFSLTLPAGMLTGPPAATALKSALWVNWLMFLSSLIPCFPFDAGPALRALLWPMLGRTSADVFVAQLARVIGWSLVAAAVIVLQAAPDLAALASTLLGTLGLLVVCSSQHELAHASRTPGVALSGLLEGAPRPVGAKHAPSRQAGIALESAPDEQWRPQGLLAADEELDPLEGPEEDEVVDDILARLHTQGAEALSEEDRRILQRASRRYRQRRG
ncbi:hypothetical protein KOR34_39320 [Posidoniimonas corsicana]|uniref:Peptidase family M50 n=1 Tax=Posidoniimonas corsicana TaxID=1938618 RepID=A0A5C5V194_9BACT|nr:hypothetical protein [Posidoniimonas corsicana]TWT32171.1 hypothetical protein KOR34_39320 [Posidoniimonas corsicana]